MEVEPLRLAPGVAGENAGLVQGQVVGQRHARIRQQRIEHPAHGEHGRPGVQPRPCDGNLAHLATRRCGALQHGHGDALPREIQRGSQPGNPGADDQDGTRTHQPAISRLTELSICIDITFDN